MADEVKKPEKKIKESEKFDIKTRQPFNSLYFMLVCSFFNFV